MGIEYSKILGCRRYLYHITEIKWREDRRCATNIEIYRNESDYLLPDGTLAQCNPDGPRDPQQAGPCCSEHGYCGGSPAHCDCTNCIDYRTGKSYFQKCPQNTKISFFSCYKVLICIYCNQFPSQSASNKDNVTTTHIIEVPDNYLTALT